eukprot:4081088-Prymnesium_polylepis.1
MRKAPRVDRSPRCRYRTHRCPGRHPRCSWTAHTARSPRPPSAGGSPLRSRTAHWGAARACWRPMRGTRRRRQGGHHDHRGAPSRGRCRVSGLSEEQRTCRRS